MEPSTEVSGTHNRNVRSYNWASDKELPLTFSQCLMYPFAVQVFLFSDWISFSL